MVSNTPHSTNTSIEELIELFSSSTSRKRKGLIKTVEKRAAEIAELGTHSLKSFHPEEDDWAAGWILQVLQRHHSEALNEIIPNQELGWFDTPSEAGINFSPLQKNLLEENFEEADRLTSECLRQLAGPKAIERGYVYFSEVKQMPGVDLVTLDRLWIAYSQGKFGFSVQSRLLASSSGRYERLWPKIGWKNDGVWTRYPTSFDWTIEAPEGHMPLINQLRGVRLMDAILNHPSLQSRN